MRYLAFMLTLIVFSLSSFALNLQVTRVLDGDTIVLHPLGQPFKAIKVRVWGIDTPEKYDTYKLQEQAQKCGVSKTSVI